MQKNHCETLGSTVTTANPCATIGHTSFTATTATPLWPLPNSLHRHCRNFFTAAAATSSPLLPLPQLLHRQPATPCPLSLHPATTTPCTTTATTLFTTTSIPLTSHPLSPPLHHTPPILSNLLSTGDPFFPFDFFCYWIFTFIMQWNIWIFFNICYNLIKIIFFCINIFSCQKLNRRWIIQKVIGTFKWFSYENFRQYMLS